MDLWARRAVWLAAVWLLLASTPSSMAATTYTLTNLGDLPGGNSWSQGYGINSYGQVVGGSSATSSLSGERAFLWTPTTPNGTSGSMTDLGELSGGEDSSRAWAINQSGQVAGISSPSTAQHAFLWSPLASNSTTGSMMDLGELPGGIHSSTGLAINAFGQVAGASGAATGTRAFLWTPQSPSGVTGSMVDLGDLPGGSDESAAHSVNASGQVAGFSQTSAGGRAFVWTPSTPNGSAGSMVDLGVLPGGSTYSRARAINDSGQVVGESTTSAGIHAFVWTPAAPNGSSGTMIDLGDLAGGIDQSVAFSVNSLSHVVGAADGGVNTPVGGRAFLWTPEDGMVDLNTVVGSGGEQFHLYAAQGINDFGQIVGYGSYDPDGPGSLSSIVRAYLLTPVPEPSGFALAAIAGAMLRRRRH